MKVMNNPVNTAGLTQVTSKLAEKATGPKNSNTEAQVKSDVKVDKFIAINDKLASAPDVDMNKVNQVRELIAEGKLTLDIDTLSDAIMEMHRR